MEGNMPPAFLSDILLNNPRNQPHCYVSVCINSRNHEADFIFLAGHPVIVAAMGDCVDADVKADENSAFVDVRDGSGIFALNLALTQIFFAGVAVHALDVRFYGNIFKRTNLYV